MNFSAYLSTVEATLLADHSVELRRARHDENHVEWFAGALTLRLEAEPTEKVTLSASIEDATVSPVSYAMTLRTAREVTHDLAALIDFPNEE